MAIEIRDSEYNMVTGKQKRKLDRTIDGLISFALSEANFPADLKWQKLRVKVKGRDTKVTLRRLGADAITVKYTEDDYSAGNILRTMDFDAILPCDEHPLAIGDWGTYYERDVRDSGMNDPSDFGIVNGNDAAKQLVHSIGAITAQEVRVKIA